MGDGFYVRRTGGERLALALSETVAHSASVREMKEDLREVYFEENTTNLLGEGSLIGGWPALAEVTIIDKRRLGYAGKRIEERTGKLFKSLTQAGSKGYYERVGENEVAFGSELDYALAQHAGFAATHLPARELIPLRPERYAEVFLRHAAEVAAAEGLAP